MAERPPSEPGPEHDAVVDSIRRIMETMQGAHAGVDPVAPPESPEQGTPNEPAQSLSFICRIAGNATREGGPATVPLSDMRHQFNAGVKLENSMGTPELVMVNPVAYATALQGLQSPGYAAEQQTQAHLLTLANVDAVISLVHLYKRQNVTVIEDMYGGFLPPGSDIPIIKTWPEVELTEEQHAIVTRLPEMAATIAQESERLGVHDASVNALRVLATAHEEGLVSEFAAAYDLGIITDVDSDAIGVDRLSHPRNWDPTYKFLQHLRDTALNTEFTRQIRDTLLSDINRQLEGGDTTVIPTGEHHPFMDAEDQLEMQAWRETTVEGAIGMLRQARQWISHLLPIE